MTPARRPLISAALFAVEAAFTHASLRSIGDEDVIETSDVPPLRVLVRDRHRTPLEVIARLHHSAFRENEVRPQTGFRAAAERDGSAACPAAPTPGESPSRGSAYVPGLIAASASCPPSAKPAGPSRNPSIARSCVCARPYCIPTIESRNVAGELLRERFGREPWVERSGDQAVARTEVVRQIVDVLPVEVRMPHSSVGNVMVGIPARPARKLYSTSSHWKKTGSGKPDPRDALRPGSGTTTSRCIRRRRDVPAASRARSGC